MANKYSQASKEAREAARRLRACESKVAYKTPEEAYQKGQTYYQCRYCGQYHRSGKFATLLAKAGNPHRLKGASKWTKRSQ